MHFFKPLVFCLTIALAGCGQDDDPPPPPTPVQKAEVPAQPIPPELPPDPAPAPTIDQPEPVLSPMQALRSRSDCRIRISSDEFEGKNVRKIDQVTESNKLHIELRTENTFQLDIETQTCIGSGPFRTCRVSHEINDSSYSMDDIGATLLTKDKKLFVYLTRTTDQTPQVKILIMNRDLERVIGPELIMHPSECLPPQNLAY